MPQTLSGWILFAGLFVLAIAFLYFMASWSDKEDKKLTEEEKEYNFLERPF